MSLSQLLKTRFFSMQFEVFVLEYVLPIVKILVAMDSIMIELGALTTS